MHHWYIIANYIQDAKGRRIDSDGWKAILDDFDKLADCFSVDVDGENWNLVLIFATGDLEQLCMKWGLKSYNGPIELCGFCLANRTSRTYTDLQEDAGWRPTENMSNEVIAGEYLAVIVPLSRHRIAAMSTLS